MWPFLVLIVSWAFALCLFDLDGFPLLLEDVSKELQCFTDAFSLVLWVLSLVEALYINTFFK